MRYKHLPLNLEEYRRLLLKEVCETKALLHDPTLNWSEMLMVIVRTIDIVLLLAWFDFRVWLSRIF